MTIERELKRGSAELMILALVEDRARHGYEMLKLMEERSQGKLSFHIGSVYPILYRLEKRGLIEGHWTQEEGARRKRVYEITSKGRAALKSQRGQWEELVSAIGRVVRTGNA
ncbi:MAG TPA: helix-turn-helix transcriptional regulator [Acidobacteriota bacterium]|nr:helix-turn-helix transcriptional regulator [Acidobacteriota bacterium]